LVASKEAEASGLSAPARDKMNVEIWPNPFTTFTQVKITSPETTKATVEVYDMLGKKVKTLYSGMVEGGVENTFNFESEKDRAQQSYMVVVRSANSTVVKRIVNMK
jgi:hypothetical protein